MVRTRMITEPDGSLIWTRKGPPMRRTNLKHSTYVESLNSLDRSREAIGFREVIDERVNLDEEGLLHFRMAIFLSTYFIFQAIRLWSMGKL